MFVLCDCQTGYVLDFVVYTGGCTDIIEGLEFWHFWGSGANTSGKVFAKRAHIVFRQLVFWPSSVQLAT
jgi:hypothetical protein